MGQSVSGVAAVAAAFVVAVSGCSALPADGGTVFAAPVSETAAPGAQVEEALSALEQLAVKGRAPKTGYARSEFGALLFLIPLFELHAARSRLVMLMLMAAAWVQIHLGLKPLHRLRNELERMRRSPSERMDGRYPSEIMPLTSAVNRLAEARERDVVRDAAREKAAEKRPDPLQREAALILSDAIGLLENDRPLSVQVLPKTASAVRWAD